MSLAEVAGEGDRVRTLEALRDRLAREIESSESSAAVASLANQLRLTLAELAVLAPPEKKGTALDQLAERRRARGAETAGVDAPAGKTEPR